MAPRMLLRLISHLRGGYIVSEDLRYGRFWRRREIRRFRTLQEAKEYAKKMVPELASAVAISTSAGTVCIYKPRMRRVLT